MHLSVSNLISHLPVEQQGPLLISKEAFLAYLRSDFHKNQYIKATLLEAAIAHGTHKRVYVDCLPDEGEAAKAVMYAFMQLAKELKHRGKLRTPTKTLYSYRLGPAPKAHTTQPRFPVIETTINGKKEKIEQYPADISWQEAEIFQYNPDYQLPDLETEPEYQHISETAHFSASTEATGYTHLYLDGDYIERIRYWNE